MLKPLRDALRTWSPGGGAPDPLGSAAGAWQEVVGETNARHSRPLRIAGDTLVVAARSSAWSEQLSFLSERILAALRERFGLTNVRRLRFRVGAIAPRATRRSARAAVPRRRGIERQNRSESVQESVARFRSDVQRSWRAKVAQGAKECDGCGSLVAPARAFCTVCENRASQERERLVSRLLFDVPWLGYGGTAALVEGLQREEFEAIRARLLARWWSILDRARRMKRLSRDRRERLVASSYVIVKSGLEPERIAPATMRNLLGDELTDVLKKNGSE